jgi:DNA-binding winged helix-turn-helix (wHTH) protein
MRFGEFRADAASGELFRSGTKVRIQDLPFRVLVELLARPGEVVTRDELRGRLWGAETFVDAEAGLNTAIAKLREALDDSADAPRYIETIPRRGYRFVAATGAPEAAAVPRSRVRHLALAALALLAVGTAMAYGLYRLATPSQPTIAVVLFHNETGDAANDQLAQQLTDATVVALSERRRYAVIGNAAILRTPRILADLNQIGVALKADYILIAQLQTPSPTAVSALGGVPGPMLTVRLHFIRVADQKHIWARGTTSFVTTLERDVTAAALAGIRESLGY